MAGNQKILEEAARAMGLKRAKYWRVEPVDGFPGAEGITHYPKGEPCPQYWNPLIDHGHALELFIKIKPDVMFLDKFMHLDARSHYWNEDNGRDQCKKFCNAITNLAAEVWRDRPR